MRYISHMSHILSLNPNFCVTTDRHTAAVFIISVA